MTARGVQTIENVANKAPHLLPPATDDGNQEVLQLLTAVVVV